MRETRKIQRLVSVLPGKRTKPFGGLGSLGGFDRSRFDEITQVFAFDYMGAAEFEHGSVPVALTNISVNWNRYKWGSLSLVDGKWREGTEGVCLHYIATDTQVPHLVELANRLWQDDDLRHRTHLKETYESEPDFYLPIGWLELDNAFLFFTKKEMRDEVFGFFEKNQGTNFVQEGYEPWLK